MSFEVFQAYFARRSPAQANLARFPEFSQLQPGQAFFVPDPPEGFRVTPIPVNIANTLLAPAVFKVREELHPVTGVPGRMVYRIDGSVAEPTEGDSAE